MLKPEPTKAFEFRARDKSKEVQKYPFSSVAPPTHSFDQLSQRTKSITIE